MTKPSWLRVPLHGGDGETEAVLERLGLNTVCREADCPNRSECFSQKTATFLILGDACTRRCRFCNIRHAAPCPVDPDEPKRVAGAVWALGLRYAVVTSVTRDDLPDGGAGHFSRTVRAIRDISPATAIEVLIPDLRGNWEALKQITAAEPDVISHNMETVTALYAEARPQAGYLRSLALIGEVKRQNPKIRSKSGFMLGLGETEAQTEALLDDLRSVGCEFLTVGQYLAPSASHLPVREYIPPERFRSWERLALAKGFAHVASGPLVRSSYHAGEALRG